MYEEKSELVYNAESRLVRERVQQRTPGTTP